MEVYLEIFDLPICIESNSHQFLQDFSRVFHHFRVISPNPRPENGASFHVSIDHICTIAHGNHTIYQSPNYRYILEYLEYRIYNLLIDKLADYYLIHAGAISHNNKAILLPARSGSGKTTLIASLLKNGFKYLSDEIAIICPKSLMVQPFPRSLNIKTGSLPLLTNFEPEMELINKKDINVEDKIHHVLVRNSSIHPVDRAIHTKSIIFVRYRPRADCTLREITKASSVFEIVKCSFNQYLFKERGIALLDKVVRDCKCYQLQFNSLGEAVRLITQIAG